MKGAGRPVGATQARRRDHPADEETNGGLRLRKNQLNGARLLFQGGGFSIIAIDQTSPWAFVKLAEKAALVANRTLHSDKPDHVGQPGFSSYTFAYVFDAVCLLTVSTTILRRVVGLMLLWPVARTAVVPVSDLGSNAAWEALQWQDVPKPPSSLIVGADGRLQFPVPSRRGPAPRPLGVAFVWAAPRHRRHGIARTMYQVAHDNFRRGLPRMPLIPPFLPAGLAFAKSLATDHVLVGEQVRGR